MFIHMLEHPVCGSCWDGRKGLVEFRGQGSEFRMDQLVGSRTFFDGVRRVCVLLTVRFRLSLIFFSFVFRV